jgi:hypothetical protein
MPELHPDPPTEIPPPAPPAEEGGYSEDEEEEVRKRLEDLGYVE